MIVSWVVVCNSQLYSLRLCHCTVPSVKRFELTPKDSVLSAAGRYVLRTIVALRCADFCVSVRTMGNLPRHLELQLRS